VNDSYVNPENGVRREQESVRDEYIPGNQTQTDGDAGSHIPYQSRYDAWRFQTPEELQPGGGLQRPGKSRSGLKTFLWIAFFAVVLSAAAVLAYSYVSKIPVQKILSGVLSGGEIPEANPEPEEKIVLGRRKEADSESSGTETVVPGIVEEVMRSMVSLTSMTEEEYRNEPSGSAVAGARACSGIIIGLTDQDILIATNSHMLAGRSDITVIFPDNTAASGVIKGADADEDLAVITVRLSDISAATRSGIEVIRIGDSDSLRVGESVIAIGNALGSGQSVSMGIVSALGCIVRDKNGTTRTLIQTDASINPGNSGGALINMQGELVGINEAKFVSTMVEGIGYAIPISSAQPILSELINRGGREKVGEENASYIGITCSTMPDTYTSAGYPKGVFIVEIEEGGPADQAGLMPNDIITAFCGKAMLTKEDLIEELTYYAAGEEVTVSVSRFRETDGTFDHLQIPVILGDRKNMTITVPDDGNTSGDEATQPESGSSQAEAAPEDEAEEPEAAPEGGTDEPETVPEGEAEEPEAGPEDETEEPEAAPEGEADEPETAPESGEAVPETLPENSESQEEEPLRIPGGNYSGRK